jgi:NAD(P)-dependent dehydrogenase (short-subunit alcohol dehydrogenase family)
MGNYLIIGARTGIGKEIKNILQTQNEVVFLTSSQNPPSDPDFLYLDVRRPESFPEIEVALNGLVYCPGTITLKPFRSLKEQDFLQDFEINLLGAFRVLQKYLPLLQQSEKASVVLFSTVAVSLGLPYHASVASAKGAVEGLTRSLASEWAPKIRVNAIAPSLTDTPLANRLLDSDSKRKASLERHPLKTIGQASDIASLACWLLSEKSQFVTGQIWKVDGGIGSLKVN